MIIDCICGEPLGNVHEAQHGLCPGCGRSRWMQAAMRRRPPADLLCAHLNETGAGCKHGHNPCISRCGIVFVQGRWVPIPEERRQQWFDSMLRIVARCACGARYGSLEQWAKLPYCGLLDDGIEIHEMRHCRCQSTIAITVACLVDAREALRIEAEQQLRAFL